MQVTYTGAQIPGVREPERVKAEHDIRHLLTRLDFDDFKRNGGTDHFTKMLQSNLEGWAGEPADWSWRDAEAAPEYIRFDFKRGVAMVIASAEAQKEMADLIERLKSYGERPSKQPRLDPQYFKLSQALDKPVTIDVNKMTAAEALQRVIAETGIAIEICWSRLAGTLKGPEETVYIRPESMSLRKLLTRIAEEGSGRTEHNMAIAPVNGRLLLSESEHTSFASRPTRIVDIRPWLTQAKNNSDADFMATDLVKQLELLMPQIDPEVDTRRFTDYWGYVGGSMVFRASPEDYVTIQKALLRIPPNR